MSNTIKFSLLLLCTVFMSKFAIAQSKDSITHFIFTSDLHFGLTKEKFKNNNKVAAYEVNKAMAGVMQQLVGQKIPADSGVQFNQEIKGIDALIITGDIANRMEDGVQSATKSWEEFKIIYIDSLRLMNAKHEKTKMFLVPGNHDMSNAIGFHRKMNPKKDPAAMMGMYNLMFPNNQVKTFDSSLCRIHFSRDLNGVHYIFLSLYPDSAERVWMEKDLKTIAIKTPVLLFAHSIPNVEPRFFENPNGIHDINEEDKFENLVPERYKDGKEVKGVTTIEQNAFVAFIKKHNNIKVYFHGHENFTEFYNYTGPNRDIQLSSVRTDSPMKGRVSAKDETKLAFELVSINSNTGLMTVREILWNAGSEKHSINWGTMTNIHLN